MNNIDKKNNIMKILLSTSLLLLLTIGISFAYFTANITGAEENTTITVTGGTMNIIYNGGANLNLSSIFPSDNVWGTKTFTVTGNNTTDLVMSYNISLNVVSNTFSNGALKYKLLSTNSDSNGSIVPSITTMKDIPTGTNILFLGNGTFIGPTSGNKVHS